VERAADFTGLAFGVEGLGLGESVRIEGDDRIDGRALFVVGGDAGQIEISEFLGGERTLLEGGVEVGDGGRFEIELRGICIAGSIFRRTADLSDLLRPNDTADESRNQQPTAKSTDDAHHISRLPRFLK
jgi:hypothetical protein